MTATSETGESCGPRPVWIVTGVLAVVLAFFLVTEHRAHLFGALPYLLVLACPLMHLFMHCGHHHDQHQQAADQPSETKE